MRTIVLLGLILATLGATFARDLPEFIQVCKKNNPNLGNCIKDSVHHLKSYLKVGLPEYKIPSLEPLLLDHLAATTGSIKLMLSNLTVYGASDFTISKMKASLQPVKITAELVLSNLSIQGNYDVDGKVILLRIRGNGPMECHFSDCKGIVKIRMDTKKGEDGQDYLELTELKTKIFIGSGSLKLQNLFGGDPVLGEAVNSAINSNFNAFIDEIKPSIESAISDKFTQIANGILPQFTYNELFPDS